MRIRVQLEISEGMCCMKKRTKLADRLLPNYSKGEEIMNMVTHMAGGALALPHWFCA